MSAVPFTDLPDDARLWVFAATRPLAPQEAATLLQRVDDHLRGWKAHGSPVVGARDLRHERFLLVAADERATGVSGCSIDSLHRALQEVERETGIELLDRSPVWYRGEGGEIRCVSRREFRGLAEAGEVEEETVVFDNTVSTVGAVRAGAWETPLRESWHARAFPVRRG